MSIPVTIQSVPITVTIQDQAPITVTISAVGTGGSGSATWGGIAGTLSNQTDLQNALNAKANTSSLATVATTGNYNDLTNKPVDYDYDVGIVDIAPPAFVDNGDGTATFAACTVALCDNANNVGAPQPYSVASATLSFTDGAQEYAVIRYNGGSPAWFKETSGGNINASNETLVYVIWRQGNTIHSVNQDSVGLGLPNKLNKRTLNTTPYAVSSAGGMAISETSTPVDRTILLTSAVVYSGVVPVQVLAFNSSTDTLTKCIHNAGGWAYTNGAQYDNTNYNPDSSGEVVMTNNRYGYRLYYRSIGDSKQVFYVESPGQYNTVADAQTASETGRSDLPLLLTGHCLLVGRSVIQKDATTGITESFVNRVGGFVSGVPAHNDLSGLQGGNTGEYYHLSSADYARRLPITGTAYLDFGAFPGSHTASVTITSQPYILATDIPSLTIDYIAVDNYSAQEHQVVSSQISLQYSDPIAGVGFTIYGFSSELIQGRISVGWRY